MTFDKSEVSKIAELARLEVTDEEIDDIESRITEILLLIDQMQSVDTDSIVPMSHPLDGKQILRSDTVSEEKKRLAKKSAAARLGIGVSKKISPLRGWK